MTINRAPISVSSSIRAHAQKGAILGFLDPPPKKGVFWGGYPPGGGIFEANLTILGVHARPQERLVVGGRVFNQALLRRGEGGGTPPTPPPPPRGGGGGGAKCNP